MAKGNEVAHDSSDSEMVVTRLFDAPRELVFKAWTDPLYLVNWWGPAGFANTSLDIDVKPGGFWHFIMHSPDGFDFPNMIVFDEVVKPGLISYVHGSGDEEDSGQFKVVVTFEPQDDKTKFMMRVIFNSAEELDMVINEHGAMEGVNQTMYRLEQELAKMKFS
ncbi:MAG: SRPBCC family protein [Flavitalea sp.]